MRLYLTASAERDLTTLAKQDQQRIAAALERLLSTLGTTDLKKMQGKPDRWRLRVGDFRIIMTMNKQERQSMSSGYDTDKKLTNNRIDMASPPHPRRAMPKGVVPGRPAAVQVMETILIKEGVRVMWVVFPVNVRAARALPRTRRDGVNGRTPPDTSF